MIGTHLDEAEDSREVSQVKVKNWTKKKGIESFEVSSKTGENVHVLLDHFYHT
jgi:hypothetical protein